MDYSALVSDTGGFGDPSEANPFAQPHTPTTTHPASPTLLPEDHTEPLQSPFAPTFTHTPIRPTADDPIFGSPTLQQHDDDNTGFRNPGFAGEGVTSPRTPPTAEHHDHVEEEQRDGNGNGQRPETQSQGSFRGQQQQQQQQGQRPVYKLQARVTALERTGRKDPILRFDVHVSPPNFVATSRYDSA